MPPLRAFATILDRRHILTEDTEGEVTLWDVTSGSRVQDFGKVISGSCPCTLSFSAFAAYSVLSSILLTAMWPPCQYRPSTGCEKVRARLQACVCSASAGFSFSPSACMQVDLAAQEKELFHPLSVAPWFTADVRLGSLAIHLELASCFAAGKALTCCKHPVFSLLL